MKDIQSPAAYPVYPVDIVYSETREELEMTTHFHNSYEIIYILEGKAQFKINSRLYTTDGSSMIFISNLESHELKVIEYPYRRYFILIQPEYFQSLINEPVLASIFKHRPEYFRHLVFLNPEEQGGISDIIKNMYKETVDRRPFWEATLDSCLHLLFVLLYRGYPDLFPLSVLNDSTYTVIKIQKYIERHYMEDISLEEVSKNFYIDMYYLSHLFKKIVGFTFKEYLILQRISKAKDLLFYARDSITQVAINSGFNNLNHFIRIFKKYIGTTPYQYRKMHKYIILP